VAALRGIADKIATDVAKRADYVIFGLRMMEGFY
jgi:hypothetical protein